MTTTINGNEKTNPIAIIAPLDATGALAEIAEALPGAAPADALGALRELAAREPGAAAGVARGFLAWGPARQLEAIDAIAGDDPAARREASRLLCGITGSPRGIGLA